MVEFNKDIVPESHIDKDEHKMECAMMLMGCLTNEDYEALKKDWHDAGGVKHMKWWEFLLKNITVRYER